MKTANEASVRMILAAWNLQIEEMNKLLAGLSDDTLSQEIAPGSYTGSYVLGHLTASQDNLFPILGICCSIFPHYPPTPLPEPEEIRQTWYNVTIQLAKSFKQIHTHEWFRRTETLHSCNKLSIIIDTTNDIAYRRGQLSLLVPIS